MMIMTIKILYITLSILFVIWYLVSMKKPFIELTSTTLTVCTGIYDIPVGSIITTYSASGGLSSWVFVEQDNDEVITIAPLDPGSMVILDHENDVYEYSKEHYFDPTPPANDIPSFSDFVTCFCTAFDKAIKDAPIWVKGPGINTGSGDDAGEEKPELTIIDGGMK